MKKAFLWFLLMNKRLYRKGVFVGLMLLVFVLVLSFYGAVQETGGVITVALAQEDANDATAGAIIHQLITESRVITFKKTTPENAVELVKTGKSDGAWIFPQDTARCIAAYSRGECSGFIRVVERQQNVALALAREKLSGAIYAPAVRNIYLQYLRAYAPETETVSDDTLLDFLEQTHITGDLFAFYDANGNLRESSGNFLHTPLRGLLAVAMVICAAVTAMYYQKDRDAGRFALLPERYSALTEFAYQAVSAVNLMTVVFVSLICTGLYQNLLQELALSVLYGLCCCLYGMILRRICPKAMAALLPGLLVVMLVGSPVFFELSALRGFSMILPPTYFIQAGYNYRYLVYLLIYDGLLAGIILLWDKILKIKFIKS